MKALARIDHGSYTELISCSVRACGADMDSPVHDYFTELHAIQAGWLPTSDPKFHDPDSEQLYSWVCPHCVRHLGEKNEST